MVECRSDKLQVTGLVVISCSTLRELRCCPYQRVSWIKAGLSGPGEKQERQKNFDERSSLPLAKNRIRGVLSRDL